jgi:hypothetical protein
MIRDPASLWRCTMTLIFHGLVKTLGSVIVASYSSRFGQGVALDYAHVLL